MTKGKFTGSEKGRYNYLNKLMKYKARHKRIARELLREHNDYFGFAREIVKARELEMLIDKLLHISSYNYSTNLKEVIEKEINPITTQKLKKDIEIATIIKEVIA